jgi:NADH:ubiquinone oxidoreductase subunit E
MKKNISSAPFKGTAEQKNRLLEAIGEHRAEPGAMMPILQAAQEIYGYLPIEVQSLIAEGLEISLEDVYNVTTFYSQFALSPKGKYEISVCLGTACYVKGAGEIADKISEILKIKAEECTQDGKFSLTACRCIGACGLAPVITINKDVYGRLKKEDIEEILAKYN